MMENPEFSACYLVAGINCLKIPIFHIMHRWMALKFFVFHRIYSIIIKSFFCAVVFFGLGFMVLFQIQHTNKQKVSMTKTVASV